MEWRVFFIGPMSEEEGYANHLEILRGFFVDRLTGEHGYAVDGERQGGTVVLRKGDDAVAAVIASEQDLRDDIPTNVFHQIDNADLVVADLTANRPSVVYELAMAHALGIETILVGSPETQSFYFSQIRFNGIDFRADRGAPESLNREIDGWVEERRKSHHARNPLSKFYGAPLFDISAASGLAAGFYDNFARPILVSGEIVERRPIGGWRGVFGPKESETTRPLRGFIVLRPDRLTDKIPDIEARLAKSLEGHFGPGEVLPGKAGQLFVRLADRSSRIPFFLVRDYMIDIPRTMFSLRLSRRLVRLQGLAGVPRTLDQNMQDVLIERFFRNVVAMVQENDDIRDKGIAFGVGKLEEIPALIEAGGTGSLPPG
jgi:hypothetical protein